MLSSAIYYLYVLATHHVQLFLFPTLRVRVGVRIRVRVSVRVRFRVRVRVTVDCSPPGFSCLWDSPGKNTSGLPLPFLGDLHNPGIKPHLLQWKCSLNHWTTRVVLI